jgi:WD40 repeat protein
VALRDAAKDVLPPRVLPGSRRPPLQIQTEEQVNKAEFQLRGRGTSSPDEEQPVRGHPVLWHANAASGDEGSRRSWPRLQALAQRKWHTGQVLAVAEADRKTLASGETIRRSRSGLRTLQVLFTLEGHKGRVTSVAYSRTARSCTAGQDGTVRSWEASTGKHQKTVTFDKVTRAGYLTLSPDGSRVAVLSRFGEAVEVWNADGTRKLATARVSPGISESMALSPDGQRVAVAGGPVIVIDLGTQKTQTHRPERSHNRAVAFSPDGKTLAVSDNEVRLLDPVTFEEREVVRVRDQEIIRCIAFSRDGKRMAVGCNDGLIKIGEPGRPATFLVLGRD